MMARLQLLALVAAVLASRADAVKMHLTPYQVDCVTEVANMGDTMCVPERPASVVAESVDVHLYSSVETSSCFLPRSSGSFVGYAHEARAKEAMGYPTTRTYFDLEVRNAIFSFHAAPRCADPASDHHGDAAGQGGGRVYGLPGAAQASHGVHGDLEF